MKRGYVQIYTGDGKGKTTAALGLALRALEADMSVYLGQFVKSYMCRGVKGLIRFAEALYPERVLAELYGRPRRVTSPFEEADVQAARNGFHSALAALESGDFDLVILDELNFALSKQLLNEDDFRRLLAARSEGTELVLTGRGAPDYAVAAADLVTRMVAEKHYYAAGVSARPGIEE